MPEPELEAIEITSAHCLGAGVDIEEGTVLEVPRDITLVEAQRKVTARLAVPVASARKKTPAPAEVESRDPAIVTGDPAAAPAQPPRVKKGKKANKGK